MTVEYIPKQRILPKFKPTAEILRQIQHYRQVYAIVVFDDIFAEAQIPQGMPIFALNDCIRNRGIRKLTFDNFAEKISEVSPIAIIVMTKHNFLSHPEFWPYYNEVHCNEQDMSELGMQYFYRNLKDQYAWQSKLTTRNIVCYKSNKNILIGGMKPEPWHIVCLDVNSNIAFLAIWDTHEVFAIEKIDDEKRQLIQSAKVHNDNCRLFYIYSSLQENTDATIWDRLKQNFVVTECYEAAEQQ